MEKSNLFLFILTLLVIYLISCSNASKIEGKTAYITGATSGIGKSVAEYLSSVGVNVVLFGRREEKGKQVEKEINAKGKGKALFVKGDVASVEDQARALKEGESKFGQINFAFANAGMGASSQSVATEGTLEHTKKLIDVNFIGSLITLQQSQKYFKKNKEGGVIVYTSSYGASFSRDLFTGGAFAGLGSYIIAKEMQAVLSRTTSSLEKTDNIRSYTIKPALYASEMVDRATKSQDVTAEQISYLNPIFKGSVGDPYYIGKMIESCFDGSTKYKSGNSFICDHFVTWPAQLFYNFIEGEAPSVELLIKEARNEKGEPISLTQEKVNNFVKRKISRDEL